MLEDVVNILMGLVVPILALGMISLYMARWYHGIGRGNIIGVCLWLAVGLMCVMGWFV